MAESDGFVASAFDALTPNLESIREDALRYTHESWVNEQTVIAGAVGAAAMAVPGAHMIALAADIGVLMNRMSVTSYGVGMIASGSEHVLDIEREDFALVLAVWAGELSSDGVRDARELLAVKGGAKVAMKVGGKLGVKNVALVAGNTLGILAGKTLGPKIGQKLGAKFAAKLAAKGTAGWIPFVGAGIGAVINGYFVRDIAGAARRYFVDIKPMLISVIDH